MTNLVGIPTSLGLAFADWEALRYICIGLLLAGPALRLLALFVAQLKSGEQFLPLRKKSTPPPSEL